MNDEAPTPPPPAKPSRTLGSPGAAIREARERLGISIEELASRTRLGRQTLEAMEHDDFDQLLEPVYVRGYYRKCARILDLQEQPLIDAYEAMYTPPPTLAPSRLRLASNSDLGSTPRISARLVIIAPIVAVVLSAVIWLMRESSTAPAPTDTVSVIDMNTASTADSVASIDTLPPIDAPAPAVVAPVTEAPAPAPTAEAAAPVQSDTGTPVDPAAVVEAPAVPTGTQLTLQFTAISWARVQDATGKSLVSGVISAGERLVLDGRPPYAVFLGNAPGVNVEFGGQVINVAPYTRSNSTARFSVPAASG
ncbi:MAG: helix-turn-helix domain-containing protein [Panacagrimonas sp.]